MNKGLKIALFVIVILIILALAYYFIFKKKETAQNAASIDCTKYYSLSTPDKIWCSKNGTVPKKPNVQTDIEITPKGSNLPTE